ncbi:MAG: tetratricopeptide repeat protein [Candidatus Coatesbacteria bacterium]|nr:MAG: tetratricopeptide repeat protein [Candidatus Coatesbacteria bacterium]
MKTGLRIFVITAVVFLYCPVNALNAEEAGKRSPDGFMSARTAALGGLNTVIDTGLYSLGANPAVLALNPAFGLSFNERKLAAPYANLITVGTTVPIGVKNSIAIGFGDLWVGGIEGYNGAGDPTGEFSYHDRTFAGGYARKFAKILAVGGDFRYRRVGYDSDSYSAALVGAGVVASPVPRDYPVRKKSGTFTFGASVSDLCIKGFDYPSDTVKRGPELNAGVAWSKGVFGNHEIYVAGEYSTAGEGPFRVGFEYSYAYTVHLRVGHTGAVPTFGIGVSQNLFDFDYALVKKELGFEHIATFSLFPGRDVRAETEKWRTIETWLNEGRAYYEAGNYDLAARRFHNVLEWDEGNETALRYLVEAKYEGYLKEGRMFLEEGNWERARRAFNAALNIMPGDALAKRYLARVDFLEEEAARLAAIEAKVASVLGEVERLNRRGLYRTSIALLNETLREIPDRDELKSALASARRLLAAAEAAAIPTEEPPKEIPNAVRTQYEKADALLASGSVIEAINVLEPVVAEYPHYIEASGRLVESYMYRGLDLYSKGYLESAMVYWRKVLTIDPGNAKAGRYIEKTETEIEAIRGGN